MSLFIDFLFPKRCCYCEKIDRDKNICDNCLSNLVKDNTIKRFKLSKKFITKTWSYRLDPILKNFFIDLKSNLTTEYFSTLRHLISLNSNQKKIFNNIDLVTFVPISERTNEERGFNTSKEIALIISKEYKIPIKELLIKNKHTREQKNLNPYERKKNLTNTFKIINFEKNNKPHNILIVDDILTTGSTINECAKVIMISFTKSEFFSYCIAKS